MLCAGHYLRIKGYGNQKNKALPLKGMISNAETDNK